MSYEDENAISLNCHTVKGDINKNVQRKLADKLTKEMVSKLS